MTTESRSDAAANAARNVDQAPAHLPADGAMQRALDKALGNTTKPVFNTHSQGLAGLLLAEERSLKEKAANVRAKIDELEAEYTDIMLAESGIAGALQRLQMGES